MAYDETDTCWHIMTVTYGGTVSILKNLDAPTARQAYRRLNPDDHPVKYINAPRTEDGGWCSFPTGFRECGDADMKEVAILGPEGEKLDPWRGVEPHVVDLGVRKSPAPAVASRA